MGSRDRTRQTPRTEADPAMTKCVEFADASRTALAGSHWNAAGLAAIHAGICAGDAALIASAGIDDEVPEFTSSQRRHLAGLLKMKNHVAYEQRLLTETEARQLDDHARRLTLWAQRVVDAHVNR
jgi:hypothetical protein